MSAVADEIAEEAVGAFSALHPDVRMSYGQWQDLRECIQREIDGQTQAIPGISARDLLAGYDGDTE
jgi:hypothetical protein